MVTPWLASRLLADEDGAASVFIVPAIVFIFTLAQQGASGYTALYGFRAFHRTRAVAWTHVKSGEDLNQRAGSPMQLAIMSFLLGTTAVALHHSIVSAAKEGTLTATEEESCGTPEQRYSGATAVTVAAAGCAAMVALIAMVVSIVAFGSRSVDRTREATESILSLLANPLLWLTLTTAYLIYVVLPFVRGRPANEVT